MPSKGGDASFVAAGRGPRMHREVTWSRADELATRGLSGWTAMWDADTRVPLRLWGPGIAAPNVLADPAVGERVARDFLAVHVDLLAPGAKASDFELVANQVGGAGNTRSVGFVQKFNGTPVVDGAIGFTFKHDHLVMVGSTALPDVYVPALAHRMPASDAGNVARMWLGVDGYIVTAHETSELVVLPMVRPMLRGRRDVSYRLAEQVVVESNNGPGRWTVWVDAVDGTPIARKNEIFFSSGKVMYDVPDRHPASTRNPQPASFASQTVNGQAVTATLDGTVTWASGNATITPRLAGTYVSVTSASGSPATGSLSLASGGSVTWSKATDERADAQLDSYVYANQAKQFARTHYNPNLAWIDQVISVNVNEGSTCNAYSTGDDIHFYVLGNNCQNTGRMADVVYHEFGHSLHNHSIIPGVGQFNSALSEGLADTNAVTMLGDPHMGVGFFLNDPAKTMRDLDPPNKEKTWQNDTTGEPHDDGEIIGEALYDMRKALEQKLGQAAGYQKTIEIYYGVMQRASDIPSSYAEALVADDDDGNVANGTPNQCEINASFKLHGLANGTVTGSVSAPTRTDFTISLDTMPSGNSACPGPAITSASVDWKVRGGTDGGTVALTKSGTTMSGDIPTQPEGTVVQYKVTVTLAGGSKVVYPANPADPMYEFYVGPVTPIWCASFEQGASDWTHGATPAGADEWEAGAPGGLAGDPRMAHGGSAVFGYDLTHDGAYSKSSTTFAESPEIDLQGHSDVRLQYYRWLTVEDGFYDKARILVNDQEAWKNFASPSAPQQTGVNHTDKEWRFQDIDLAPYASNGKVKLRFELASDEGLQFGGWTMDDVCIVYKGAAPNPMCGNGNVDPGEQCDDGNRNDGDGCSASCQNESGGGDGGDGDGPGKDAGGCCSSSHGAAGAFGLSILTLGLVLRRRKNSR